MANRHRYASRQTGMFSQAQTARPRPGACKFCGRDILWIAGESGKPIPVEVGVTKIVRTDGVTHVGHLPHDLVCPPELREIEQRERRRAAAEAAVLSTPPERMWPRGTDPWDVIDAELKGAYEAEDRNRPGEDIVTLRELVHLEGTEPICLELPTARAREYLRRLLIIRLFGCPVLMCPREQVAPPLAWLCRHPKLLERVRERIAP